MHDDPRGESPFNALPPVVVGLALAIAAVELMFLAAEEGLVGGREGIGWRTAAIGEWAVSGAVWDWMVRNATFPPEALARFVTYPFLHGGFGHAAFTLVFVLAFGNVVARVFVGWRVLALFLAGSLAGALAVVLLFDRGLLFGAYPGAYGLIGAFTFLARKGLTGVPPDRAFLLLAFVMAIQPVFALVGGGGWSWLPDWVAEGVGAAAGYGVAAALFPGGLSGLRDRARRR